MAVLTGMNMVGVFMVSITITHPLMDQGP